MALLKRKNRTIKYRREVGGRTISVNRHLPIPYLFMNVEKAEPQEQIAGLDEDGAAGTTTTEPSEKVQDEVSNT